MILAQFVFVGMLLHLAVTIPVQDGNQDKVSLAYDNQEDPYFWQKSGKIEGDMVLTPEQQEYLYKGTGNRNGVIDTSLRWPNRVIPYVFSEGFTAKQQDFISKVLTEEYAKSCVRVVPRTNESDYVYITDQNTGCWSFVGRLGGRQELNLQRPNCVYYHLIVHEFLHAAGFYHQHSASDRDDYITIQWENIKDGKEHNFIKYASNVVTSFGERYDYETMMHYNEFAFTKNIRRTIVPKEDVELGTSPRFTKIDIAKLNKMYGC